MSVNGECREIEIEPENADAVRVFLAMQTQWRLQLISNGKIQLLQRTGLDYAAMPAIASALAIDMEPRVFAGLQLLETETLALHRVRCDKLLARS